MDVNMNRPQYENMNSKLRGGVGHSSAGSADVEIGSPLPAPFRALIYKRVQCIIIK